MTTLVNYSSLRVVLRGFNLRPGASCVVCGEKLVVLSRANPTDWPTGIRSGDLEAVAWCAPAEAERTVKALLAHERVVAVRVDQEPNVNARLLN